MLIYLLSIASVSPLLHEKLHCSDAHGECSSQPSEEDVGGAADPVAHFCAVNWLAGGVLLLDAVNVPTIDCLERADFPIEYVEYLDIVSYLCSDARAPPLKLI